MVSSFVEGTEELRAQTHIGSSSKDRRSNVNRSFARASVLALCAVAGLIVWAASSSAGSRSVGAERSAKSAGALWLRRYNGPGRASDVAYKLEPSPDGSRVYVTGESVGATGSPDYATIAYDAATGATLWVRRYHDPSGDTSRAFLLAVSPDGSRVFVSGFTQHLGTNYDIVTVGYDASSGAQLWVRQYRSASGGNDEPSELRVSPDSSKVFVTGESTNTSGNRDFVTIAYDAATGGT
jgi:hypothetical protein